MKSDNLVQMDELWQAYVKADPDLSRMEETKRRNAYRRIYAKSYARQQRVQNRRERKAAFVEVLQICVVGFLIGVMLALLLCL
jgi:hypothetical protein